MNSARIEEALKTPGLTVRELHALWELGQPSGDGKKRTADVAWVEEDLETARLFAQRALEMEEYLLVSDVAQEALKLWPEADAGERTTLIKMRMHYAVALTRLGQTRAARAQLDECVADDFQPQLSPGLKLDLLLQLGNILREESQYAAAREIRLQTAREALGFYERALALAKPDDLRPLVYCAAASLVVSGPEPALRAEAERKAKVILEVVAKLENEAGQRFDTTTSRGVGHALLGNFEAAARAFGELAALPEATTGRLAEVRYRTQFIAEALNQPRDLFRSAFPPLELVVFSGHRTDRPGGPRRFPIEAVEQVRARLCERLKAMQARVGLVGADAGADLLFGEALLQQGGTLHVVLPWSRDEFHRTNVAPFEPAGAPPLWKPIFQRNLEKATTLRELGQAYEPASDLGFEYAMEVTAGLALHIARVSRLDVKPMALWDGMDGPIGGTASFVNVWRSQLGKAGEIEILSLQRPADSTAPPATEDRTRRCERSILQHEVKSMLFADIVGYSRLTEHAIPDFVSLFLDRVSRLAASSNHGPRSLNTWGDAIYAVFDFTRDAGAFALELTRMVQEGKEEWLRAGLYWEEMRDGKLTKHPLNVRIGLHTGPVFMHYDPVVRRLGFTGAHVNRAARIEPIARPGEAYASEEFAALAQLDMELRKHGRGQPAPEFVCEYGGTMPLAKGYPGRYRIYRLLPYRTLEIEELAKTVHELYCAEARARGETLETNFALRPWEQLPESLRNANRAQVADISTKLRLLGYELAPNDGLDPSEILVDDATLEKLSVREHARWMSDRQQNGWTFGASRDDARKLHPSLIPWEQLSETEKDKDRETVRNLPKLVKQAGFRVRKLKA